MKELMLGELDTDNRAKERVMLERLLDKAKTFYKNADNIQAFMAWKTNKEGMPYGTDNDNT